MNAIAGEEGCQAIEIEILFHSACSYFEDGPMDTEKFASDYVSVTSSDDLLSQRDAEQEMRRTILTPTTELLVSIGASFDALGQYSKFFVRS